MASLTSDVTGTAQRAPLKIVVLGQRAFESYALPERGEVVLGRSEKSDVRIDDPSVTRKHAVLYVDARLEIEDLGSVNGTRIGEERLARGERVEVTPGQAIHLGTALVMIQASRSEPLTTPADEVETRRAHAPPETGAPMGSAPPRPRVERVVEDPRMRDVYAEVERIAAGAISVLVLGETGVGKELVAEHLHRRSPRAARPFVRLNCAALPEALLEAELFGYERGAFTGAVHPKEGLLELADGGTVFLDEIGELPLALQAKMLRVLEDQEVLRVGGLRPRRIDVRFVAATNRALDDEIRARRFRQDLYFRLNGATLFVPPLRERTREIAPLARSFIASVSASLGRPPPALSAPALVLLERYGWPGNVRELRNFIERAVLLCSAPALMPEHFPIGRMAETLPTHALVSRGEDIEPAAPTLRPPALGADAERERILKVLADCGGNQSRAAKALGIARSTLVARLDGYGVPRPRKA